MSNGQWMASSVFHRINFTRPIYAIYVLVVTQPTPPCPHEPQKTIHPAVETLQCNVSPNPARPMQPTGPQLDRLKTALFAAFDPGDLEMFLHDRLNVNLN